jgi:hypothetical protein
MTQVHTMLSLAEDYLVERRSQGFDLRIPGEQIKSFGRFVDQAGHNGPLTTASRWTGFKAEPGTPPHSPGRAASMSFVRSPDIWRGWIRTPSFRRQRSSAGRIAAWRPTFTPSVRSVSSSPRPGASRHTERCGR